MLPRTLRALAIDRRSPYRPVLRTEMKNHLNGKQSKSHRQALLETENMIRERSPRPERCRGFSLVELLIVLVIAGILSAIALPMMISQRRLTRFSGVTREFMTQLRHARQLAMSERQAVTF